MNHNLKITNSLTRSKELFEPINAETITMYACGPTVYDNPHVGNARTLVVFDVLFRTTNAKTILSTNKSFILV